MTAVLGRRRVRINVQVGGRLVPPPKRRVGLSITPNTLRRLTANRAATPRRSRAIRVVIKVNGLHVAPPQAKDRPLLVNRIMLYRLQRLQHRPQKPAKPARITVKVDGKCVS